MSIDLQCPSCHALLRVADAAVEWGACPRCLARIDLTKKNEGVTAQAPPSVAAGPKKLRCSECGDAVAPGWRRCPNCGGSLTAPDAGRTPAPSESGTLRCPECDEPAEPNWQCCPKCGAALVDWNSQPHTRNGGSDVRRDTQSSSVLLALLALVGGIGLTISCVASLSALAHDQGAGMLTLIMVLLFLILISFAIMMLRTHDNPAERGVGRLVFGTLALAGGLMTGLAAVGLAVFLVLFVACLTGTPIFDILQ